MDGNVSSLLQALLIMAIATVALAGAITGIASKYNVQQSDEVNNIVSVMDDTVNKTAEWGASTRNQTTTNDWSNIFQLTSGTFQILSTIMFSLPYLFSSRINAHKFFRLVSYAVFVSKFVHRKRCH